MKFSVNNANYQNKLFLNKINFFLQLLENNSIYSFTKYIQHKFKKNK